MITLILIIIAISLLILVHEWGHFYSARRLGVRVEEFGFGFPPKLFSVVRNGVRYSINLLPLGGFVKIFGEHGEGEGNQESFAARPAYQRFIILVAGVFMNFVLAWAFFSAGAAIGIPHISDDAGADVPVSILSIAPRSPAESSGLKFGDKILELRAPDLSLRPENEKDVRDFIDAYRGEEITLVVQRGSEVLQIKATPRATPKEGEGPLGIALGKLSFARVPWYFAPIEGFRGLVRTTSATFEGLFGVLKTLLIERKTDLAVSGPVGIFFFADDTRSLGISFFLQFIGILSVNLAVLNFLPIPALDGGRILFLVIEKLKGKKVNPDLENLIHSIGFVLLIILMVVVTYRDIVRIF